MAGAGVTLLQDLDGLAAIGFTEVLKHIPHHLRLRRAVRRFLVEKTVDLFIPIDYPGFNLPLAGFAHDQGIPVLYYIAPQVWAWRKKRAHRLAAVCDLICVALDFEEPFLAGYGANVRFVGHPLLDDEPTDEAPEDGTGAGEAARPPVLALFPGSREQEVRRLLPVFAAAARRTVERFPGTKVIVARAAHLGEEHFRSAGEFRLTSADSALRLATAAVSKSGTITLQLALAGVPFVVGYRVGAISAAIVRRVVSVQHACLVNLVAGAEIVPEFLQEKMTAQALSDAVVPLLDPRGERARRMQEGFAAVRSRLGKPGVASRVAEHAISLMGA
jgi:lipid-A-disaccharide synthase